MRCCARACPVPVVVRFLFFFVLPLVSLSALGDLQTVWQIGINDDPLSSNYAPTSEFSQENFLNDIRPGKVTRRPGDPLYNASNNPGPDDDFYCAGNYPAGFNGLTASLPVAFNEPDSAWELALTDGDKTNRVHFMLTPGQAGSQSRLRLSFELVWGGVWYGAPINASDEGFGLHDVVIRFKNSSGISTLLYTNRLGRNTRVTLDFSAASVAASSGPNTVELFRTGPAAANTSFWIQFDYLQLEANTNALADADGDGLPRWWEEENHLSDSNPADALLDVDGDGLTALQEYNGGLYSTDPRKFDTDGDGLSDGVERMLGTNPLLVDTDGDSLSDREEFNGTPQSNPLVADSDGDGASDALERRLGTNPMNSSNAPTMFRGGVGIHFVSQNDLDGVLGSNEVAGVVPQARWNDTLAIRGWTRTNGGKADIATPIPGQLVRSDGLVLSNFTFNWKGDASDATQNRASSNQKLMDGFIRAYGSTPLTVTLSNIPFAHYDLYVHVGGSYDGQHGSIQLGANAPVFFETTTTSPQTNSSALKPGVAGWQRGNLAHYTNQTASVATLTVTNLDGWALGIHSIQVVDRDSDVDASGIPDWYEMKYALEPGTAALAASDSDGDGLSNLQEYQLGTDPHRADTDGDGLNDGMEFSLGTNPLNADTDGDGLSDGAEINGAIPTNPKIADTDGDGVSDRDELFAHTDPNFNPASSGNFIGYLPFYRISPQSWEWTLDNVQLVWDHGSGGLAPNIWNEDQLISFEVKNTAGTSWSSLGMELRYYLGSLSYLFYSDNGSAFGAPNDPNNWLWDAYYNGPVPDLKASLGFSGYGPADISDRLRFRMTANRGAGNSWAINFEIRNQTSNTVVVSRNFANCTAAPTMDNGSVSWSDLNGTSNWVSMTAHQGVKLFMTPTPLETLPSFAYARDSDNDGMPDLWEDANGFNKLSAADAVQDADGDGLNNRAEYLAGTNPRNADTDGDGVRDLVERTNASNPLLASSRPEFLGFTWPAGQDLNGDGLPDLWEIRYHAFNISPASDADGDGASNAQEAMWGTDPFDPNSKISMGLQRQGNDALISWPMVPGKDQKLFLSTNLLAWAQSTAAPILANGISSARLTNRFNILTRENYRVSTGDKDTDGDGVPDWAEAVMGSDPTRANSSRAAAPVLNSNGVVTGNIAGDYAEFVEQAGGGGGGSTGLVTRAQAARFLQQASFGPTARELDRVQQRGFAAWIDDQITNQPATLHRKYIEQVYADFDGARTDLRYSYNSMDNFINGNNCTTPFARAAIAGPDQLRQRVAFALSQILVASRRDPNLENKPLAMSDFYDIFVRNAFGDYYDVLRAVAFHPVMGRYLSHVGNQKARPELNQYPDENFAREVQQLFTIGLWQLNPDGSRQLDAQGQPIPTYGNKEVTEFARVFTGLWFGGQAWGNGGWSDDDSSVPMQMWAGKHDFGSKTLHNGFVIPERAATVENGVKDVEDALRNLFEHPNTAPFISRQLIQFLVTSNPSSNYLSRVAAKFANNGAGKRGDLAAVVKAILLDSEARDARWFIGAAEFGRLKEPVQRAMAVARAGRLDQYTNLLWWTWGEFNSAASQEPGYSPSVFNFYRPGYQPPGLLTQRGLVGPAFQITDSYSSISFPNKLWEITQQGLIQWQAYRFPPDYLELMIVADNPPALLDQVNLLFCGGSMTSATRDRILAAVLQVPSYDLLLRTRLAVYLGAACPEGAVQR